MLNVYRKDDAESPLILEKESETLPLWPLPEVRLLTGKLRQHVAIIDGYTGTFNLINTTFRNLKRLLVLIFSVFLGGGCAVAPPVLAVEASGSRRELLGSWDYVENSESSSSSACRWREDDDAATEWFCSGVDVEDSGYGESHEWVDERLELRRSGLEERKDYVCFWSDTVWFATEPTRFYWTIRLGPTFIKFQIFKDKFDLTFK